MARLHDLFLVAAVVVASSSLTAATLTVDLNGGADYTDIQSAIDAAADGDTVLVKPGEYVITEPINFNRLHDPDDPASPPVKNIIVKSEQGAGVTTIRMSETPANPDRASVVIFENGETAGAKLDGFSVVGGRGTLSAERGHIGGGVHCQAGSSPTLTNCMISTNWATSSGGGVSCTDGSSPTLNDCTISTNSVFGGGGGVYCNNSSPTLTDCGVFCNNSSPVLTDSMISENAAIVENSGGGVACINGSKPTLINCTIAWNWAAAGGGVCCSNSSPTLTNCTIMGNLAYGTLGPPVVSGGGVFCSDSSMSLTNCTISGNTAYVGGGVYCSESSSTFRNCTISGNSAQWEGGGVYCFPDSSPILTDCIIWGNTPESVCGSLSHCLIDQDPLFVQPGEWMDCESQDDLECIAYQWNPETGEPSAWHRWVFDYHLQPGSPAIDAGTADGAPPTDIEGHGRPCGAGVDIGAYESGDCASPGCGDPNGDEDLDGVKNGSEDLNGDGVCAPHDTDGDGIPNILDSDDDGDGVPTADELVYQDTDGDEIPNYLDDDDDGDGIPSRLEDLNGNGDPSDDDPNSDGIPAYLDPNEKTPLVLFRRGDANDDTKTDISDAIATLGYLFLGNPNRLDCHKAADMDDSGVMDISDAVYLLSFQFLGGPAPEQPYPACGLDGTVDLLTCEEYIGCP